MMQRVPGIESAVDAVLKETTSIEDSNIWPLIWRSSTKHLDQRGDRYAWKRGLRTTYTTARGPARDASATGSDHRARVRAPGVQRHF